MSSPQPEPLSKRELLDRAVEAEVGLESARARAAELESRLRAILGEDPEVARARGEAWENRAVNAERLLTELHGWLRDNPSVAGLLPTGFDGRLSAQLQAAATEESTGWPFAGERPMPGPLDGQPDANLRIGRPKGSVPVLRPLGRPVTINAGDSLTFKQEFTIE